MAAAGQPETPVNDPKSPRRAEEVSDPHPGSVSDGTHPEAKEERPPPPSKRPPSSRKA